jgi:fructokinase
MSFEKQEDNSAGLDARGGIIVLGEALIDVFPERNVVGGAPFNVACSAAALGANVCLITRLGDDANGHLVRAGATRFGVSLDGVQTDVARPTGTVQVRIGVGKNAGENYYTITDDQAWDYLDLQPAIQACADLNADYLYFGTLAQRSVTSRETIRHLVKAFTGKVYLDLNLRDMPDIRAICEDSLALADIVKVNEEELRTLFKWLGEPAVEDAAEDAAYDAPWQSQPFKDAIVSLVKKFTLTGLLVTRGTKGYAYFDESGIMNVEGLAVSGVVVADTVGAGDSFSAMFLASRSQGMPIDQSLVRASELAAAICGVHGAVPASKEFYSRWYLASDTNNDKHKETRIHG